MEDKESKINLVIIACDKGGFDLKTKIKEYLLENDYVIVDVGIHLLDQKQTDYIDICKDLCAKVNQMPASKGIVVSDNGINVEVVCNKFRGIRCALCHDYYTSEMTRKHNDSNILALGQSVTGFEVAKQMVEIFLKTPFDRSVPEHWNRLKKIEKIENEGAC
eukprot:TRINITY_DN1050_c0_g2_i1.p1 TRINITY_DN1050_c0_g2~~TRINITY_DN1050_c0_g2_i1.p1  ORF type:complete len:162 (-),score=34.79 TRINITY_DN1050_c0_g2_i1:95-580(-)